MTTLDPKHLDALDALIAHNMQWRGLEDIDRDAYKQAREAITALRAENDRLSTLWQIEHDHATALRAQIDRDRAATIEAAAKACEAVAGNWSCGHMPPHCDCARDVEQWQFAADEVRHLHTDATRAAMDAIRREGYEAGVREERAKSADLANAARDLADCCQIGEDADWDEGEDPLSALRAVLAARS